MNHEFINRRLTLLIIFVFISLGLCYGQFAGGTGSEANPYQVQTADQLNDVRNYLSAHFVQIADIDLETHPYNTGTGWIPIGSVTNPFVGRYAGNGYEIQNLYISRPGVDYQGLFGVCENAYLTGIILVSVNIYARSYIGGLAGMLSGTQVLACRADGFVYGMNEVGALIGSLEMNNILGNSSAACQVTGQNSVGGLVGYNKASSIIRSCFSSGQINGNNAIGGMIGTQGNSTVNNSFSTASVIGSWAVGGLVGINDFGGFVSSCYSIGSVTGNSGVGGLIGRRVLGNTQNSYWDVDSSGQSISAGGSGRYTFEMTFPYESGTYSEWDFDNTWIGDDQYETNSGYPYLYWMESLLPPEELIANAGIDQVELVWQSPASSHPRGYNIYRDEIWIATVNRDQLSFIDYIEGGNSYLYYITALYPAGESIPSNIVEAHPESSITLPEPPALVMPVNEATDVDPETLQFVWEAAAGGSPADAFTIYISPDMELLYEYFSAEIAGSTTSFSPGTDLQFEQGQQWYWTVVPQNSAGSTDPELCPIWSYTTQVVPMFAGGSGTDADPYLVATAAHLNNVRFYLDAHYLQVADIDLGVAPWNEGNGWIPIAESSVPFTGVYNGNNHLISGMYLNFPYMYGLGLFSRIEGASILNMGLTGVEIYGESGFAGSLVATAVNSFISNCFASGSINLLANNTYTGGLVGELMNGSILSDSYASVKVSAYRLVGGLVGLNAINSAVTRCYSNGLVSGSMDLAGLIARNIGAQATDSYWDIDSSGQTTSNGGTGLSTLQMLVSWSFPSWDFADTWQMEQGITYPYLAWQGTPGTFNYPDVPLPLVDLEITNLTGPQVLLIGSNGYYTVDVRNLGSVTQEDYSVVLFDQDNNVLHSVAGAPLTTGTSISYGLSWTPISNYEGTIYAMVILDGDENPDNNTSNTRNLVVYDQYQLLTLGSGDSLERVPVDMYWRNSIFETIFPASELGFAGTIFRIDFYNDFENNLLNMPTKIWLGETPLNDMSSGWISSNELQEVYSGGVNYPSGENTISITLQSPYTYQGGNLVLLVQRPMDTTYYLSTNRFKAQSVGQSRSRRIQSDTIEYNPADMVHQGTLSGLYPKTTLHISGTVFLDTPSNLMLTYQPGNHWLSLGWDTIPGVDYYNVYRNQELIGTTVDNIYEDEDISHRTTYSYHVSAVYPWGESDPSEEASCTVYFRPTPVEYIAPADGFMFATPQQVLEWNLSYSGDMIEADGYILELISFATGDLLIHRDLGYDFSFTPVDEFQPDNTYQWRVTPYIDMDQRNGVNRDDEPNYLYAENCPLWTFGTYTALAPRNVFAAQETEGVLISWSPPASANSNWIHYDNGINYSSIGTGTAIDMDVAIRFPASALEQYAGSYLTEVKVWPASEGQFSIRVWTGGNAIAPGAMVVDQPFVHSINTYNNVFLNTPVFITGSEEIWIGYRCNVQDGYPAGCDQGPAIDGFGNMIFLNGYWASVKSLAPSIDYNWNIQGLISDSYRELTKPAASSTIAFEPERRNSGKLIVNPRPNYASQETLYRSNPSPIGYKIWRLMEGEENNENLWDILSYDVIPERSFHDYDWNNLAEGSYKWAVKSVYPGDYYSNAAISNILQKYPPAPEISIYPASFDITMDSTDSAELSLQISNLGEVDLEWNGIINEIFRNWIPGTETDEKPNHRRNLSRNLSLYLQPSQGVIAPGDSETIWILVESVDTDYDQYNYQINISSNDPLNPSLDIPLSIIVSSPVAYIPDDNFRMAINEHLGQDEYYQPTIADLNGMTGTLHTTGMGCYQSIEGAQHLINLQTLYLDCNSISDISPLAGLVNLQHLYLWGNPLSDVSPLAGLTNLQTLDLNQCLISDISALANLTNLITLNLTDNPLSDISALAGMGNLQELHLENGQVSDISPFASLSNLRFFDLSGNQVSDISPLTDLSNLLSFDLSYNQISNSSPLAGLTNLQGLELGDNQISDISPLSGLTNLNGIYLDRNNITDISPLASLSNLRSLWLIDNQISDISPIANLSNLTNLRLQNNPLSYESMLLTQSWTLPWSTSSYNPIAPCYPVPLRNAADVNTDTTLSWKGNYNLVIVNFEVYLGTNPSDLLYIGNGIPAGYTTYQYQTGLNPITQYWWRIKAVSGDTEIWSGLWSFTTGEVVIPDEAIIAVYPQMIDQSLEQGSTEQVEIEITNSGNIPLLWTSAINDLNRSAEINGVETIAPRIQAELMSKRKDTSAPLEFSYTSSSDATVQSRSFGISLDPEYGDVTPDESAYCYLNIDSGSSPTGTYHYQLVISSNAVNEPELIVPITVTVTGVPAYIPDDNFRMAINSKLGQDADYQPTIVDLNGMTGQLGASSMNIQNIEGAQYLTNLQELSLHGNQISDLSPLSGLTNLHNLGLGFIQISDLSPLAGLTNLLYLDLWSNQISDLSPLSGLTNLLQLYLGYNQISDISPLSGLTYLQYLYLGYNQIGDISPLYGLTNLLYLYINNNQISDISPLSGLTNLPNLHLGSNLISDLNPLSGLTSLQYLSLGSNQISDTSPLAGLTNLQTIDFNYNHISDVSPLSGLTDLQQLHLLNNHISDINPLSGLTNLLYLDIDGNPLSYESMLITRSWDLPYATGYYNSIAACYPEPPRGEEGVNPNIELEWQANYEYLTSLVYEVYLGTSQSYLTLAGEGTLVYGYLYSFTTALEPYTQYWWKVKAVSGDTEIWSGLWSFTTGEYQVQLNPPQNLTATGTFNAVNLKWDEPNPNRHSSRSQTGYRIYRDGTNFGDTSINDTEYYDTDVVYGTIYQYYVTAVYDEGESLPSNIVSATPLLPVNGLVRHYSFDGDSNDSSGANIHAEVIGAALTYDRFGNPNSAYSFDGSSYLKASSTGLPSTERTVSLWFKASNLDTNPNLVGYGGNYGGSSWLMGINHWGNPAFTLTNHEGYNTLQYFYDVQPLNQWYHYTITTSDQGTKIYINGMERASNSTFVDNTYVFGRDLAIGACVSPNGEAPYEDGNVGYFVGSIDDVRIYNRALSQQEIQNLLNEFEFAGGSGTAQDPYLVANAEHLNNVRNYLGSYFKQVADIDLGVSPWNSGEGWLPIGNSTDKFTGSYDGDHFTISGLYINRPAQNYQGLFGYADNSTLTNMTIFDVDIHAYNWSSSLIGRADNSDITECASSGSVHGQGGAIGGLIGQMYYSVLTLGSSSSQVYGGGWSIGGLIGRTDYSSVYKSYSTGDVSGHGIIGGLIGYILANSSVYYSFSTGNVMGNDDYLGGFAGDIYNSMVDNCYSTGNVAGNNVGFVAGFTGEVDNASLVSCYSVGSVTGGSENYGGFVGYNTNYSSFANCYWNIETSGQQFSAGAEGRSTAEMTYPYATNTYEYWNFTDMWVADASYGINGGYPYLQWYADAPSQNPLPAHSPVPEDMATGVPTNTQLGWTYTSDPAYLDPIGYKVYIWQDGEAGHYFYYDGGPGTYLVPSPITLETNQTYNWVVIPTTEQGVHKSLSSRASGTERNSRGDALDCPVWQFDTNVVPTIDIVIGTGTSINTTTGTPTPYGTYYKNFRQQYLYTADEIINAGGFASSISSIAFNVSAVNNCSPMPNYTIRLKHTDQQALSTTFETGEYSTVFVQDGFSPENGWNTHQFSTPFVWNGYSNLIVDIITTMVSTYTQNASVYYTPTTGVNTSLRYHSDTVDAGSATTGTPTVNRANIRLGLYASNTPILVVTPDVYDFGSVYINSSDATAISVSNHGGGVLEIDGIYPGGNQHFIVTDIPNLPLSLQPLESFTFQVIFSPWESGTHNETIEISSNAGTIAVQVSGTAIQDTGEYIVWQEDFGSTGAAFPPAGWTRMDGIIGGTYASGSQWVQDDWLNITTPSDKAAKINIYGAALYGWLITPATDLTGNEYRLEFDLAYMAWNTSNPPNTIGYDDIFAVLLGDGASWTTDNIIRQWDNQGSEYILNDVPHTGTRVSIPISANGQMYIAFYASSSVTNADNDLMIDNVQLIRTLTSLPAPENLSAILDGQTVLLSWDAVDYATAYNVYGSSTPDIPESFVLLATAQTNSYIDSSETLSEAYYVTALNGNLESEPSNIAYVSRIQPIGAKLSIDYSQNVALLTWEKIRNTDEYLVYHSEDPYAVFPDGWTGPILVTADRFVDPLANKRFYKVLARIPNPRNSPIVPDLSTGKPGKASKGGK